jgi:hypothetical protein
MESMVRELNAKVNRLTSLLDERMEREARVTREDVIRNPRLSSGPLGVVSGISGVSTPMEDLFGSPLPVRRQGRFTLSPQPAEEVKEASTQPLSRPTEDAMTDAQRRVSEERLLKKVTTPPTFSGNEAEDDIPEVRDWVEKVDDFFDCMMGQRYDGDLALTFVKNNLRGPAHDWMKSKVAAFEEAMAMDQSLPESQRGRLKWSEVKRLLVEAFESPQYQVMKRFELQELRLGQGKHTTLPIFNAAFDKLSRRLYPIGTDFENNAILDRVLADEYSTILERSDIYLWKDVVKTGPRTLSQWKASTAVVWSAREVLRANEQRQRQLYGHGGRGGRRGQFTSRPQGGAAVGTQSSAQNMDTTSEEGQPNSEAESEEDTPGAAAQQMQADRRGGRFRSSSRRPRSTGPRLLTDAQMQLVWDKRLCLQCYKPGHRIGEDACEEKGKPRRKPRADELKA